MTVSAILGAVLLAGGPGAVRAANDGAMPPGKADFIEMGCKQCHGYQGQGGGNGPRIASDPLPFEAFTELVRRPGNVMPAYPPGQLGDAKLKRIYEYLESQPQPPDPDRIPALKAVNR